MPYEKNLEIKIATREHVLLGNGIGISYCSKCEYNLGFDQKKEYDKCPNCNSKLVEGKIHINKQLLDSLK